MTIRAFDDFNRADSSGLGANWNTFGAAVDVKGNRANISSLAGTNQAFYAAVTLPNDQGSQATFKLLNNLSWAAVIVRGVPSTYYAGGASPIDNSSSIARRIWKNIGGTRTSLATEAVNVAVDDVIRVEVRGTTIKLIVNDSERLSVVDTSIASGSPGLIGRCTVVDSVQFDDWSGKDFATYTALERSRRGISRGVNLGVA